MRPSGRGKPLLFVAVLLVLVAAATEGISRIAVRWAPGLVGLEIRDREELLAEQSAMIRGLLDTVPPRREVVDPALGWRYRAGFASERDRISVQGLRGERTYAPAPPPGVTRVAAFGDSFVYGTEVVPAEAWPRLAEAMDSSLEVLNYGVGGYGTDQAYLRFLAEGMELSPHLVIIGFAPVNLQRVVNVYRRFLSDRDMPLVKPRFVVEGDSLRLLPNPVPDAAAFGRLLEEPGRIAELGDHDHWYAPQVYEGVLHDHLAAVRLASALARRIGNRIGPDRLLEGGVFHRASSAYRIQLLVFRDFAAAVRRAGAVPLVVIFPDAGSLGRLRAGRPGVYAPLPADLRAMGLDVVDLADAFLAKDAATAIEEWFMPGGHYSPEGNRVVAAWLVREIARRQGTPAPSAGH